MSEPLKISVLDRTNTQDFEQLIILLKRFTIDTYIRNRPEFPDLTVRARKDMINAAMQEFENPNTLSVLTPKDLEELKKEIDSQIELAKEKIDNKLKRSTETRYYVMKDGDRIVAFQMAQVGQHRDNGRVVGWRPFAYAEPDYRGYGQVIDSRGVMQQGKYSKIIYDDIGQWFEDNGVDHEKTGTGVNMLPNLALYITELGFLPILKHGNGKHISLEKFKEHKVGTKTLKTVYDLYCKHRKRTEHKSQDEILEEIMSTPEFEELTEEQKQGLLQCFFKEEKGKNGFEDCIEDDRTTLSSVQSTTQDTKDNVLGDANIEGAKEEKLDY